MTRRKTLAAATTALLLLTLPAVAPAAAPPAAEVQKPIKTVINAIRYGKDDLAAKQLAFDEMVRRLFADSWGKLTPADQERSAKGLEAVIRALSFTKGKEMFAHLDAVLYGEVRSKGSDVLCKSTIVVHRNYKKTELVIDWVLMKDAGGYRIVDMIMLGESTLAGIREDQVEPLLAEGGTAAVLAALDAKVAEVTKK